MNRVKSWDLSKVPFVYENMDGLKTASSTMSPAVDVRFPAAIVCPP